jgi:hypothetical protein
MRTALKGTCGFCFAKDARRTDQHYKELLESYYKI